MLMAEGKKECWKASVSDYQFSWQSSCVNGLVVDFIHFQRAFSGWVDKTVDDFVHISS